MRSVPEEQFKTTFTPLLFCAKIVAQRLPAPVPEEVVTLLAKAADGDACVALNALELARFGVRLGSVWGRFGIGLGSVRGRLGVPGSLEAGFCL